MLVSFDFKATAGLAPLTATLPNTTAIYNEWPPEKLRVSLPKYQRVATVVPNKNVDDSFTVPEYNGHRLMSTPIHVRDGDFLSVSLKNSLPSTGLSIHWHGFEMAGHLELDGVVGVTQCPISPDESFTYAWEVKETPGTYWYHTHSGELGVDAYNAIMGPLIVHPKLTADAEDTLSAPSKFRFLDPAIYTEDPRAQQKMSFDDLLFYGNERILFFKGGFLHSGAHALLEKVGGMNPPISYNDDKFGVGTYPWNFGTCNGKMREVVPASPGQTLKFRILNAGSMYALRVAFDGYRMTVVAADSEPVEPVEVDEIILHAAERFDVIVKIPVGAEIGSTSWIRADTLESQKQGYQNGIRAILHIVDEDQNASSIPSNTVPDPSIPIETTTDHKERLTHNCYSHIETVEASGQGGCIPVSSLRLEGGGISHGAVAAAKATAAPAEHHIIDWQFSAAPQMAHFVRIDGGKWYQFAMFSGHSMLMPDYDADKMLHPNGAVLNVDAGIGAIVIWRNKSSMDHPIHVHGMKLSILDQHVPKKSGNCDHSKCTLSEAFASDEALEALEAIPPGSRALKDTFILPAGGAVATRFYTGDPALWFAHCHLESHRETGMAMIVNVGDYKPPADSGWLPQDYPSCSHPFLLSKKEFPSCDCYINKDALLDGALTKDHRCSRDYLCFHEDSPQSNLEYTPYESDGISIRSEYTMPGWGISLIIVVLIAFASGLIGYRNNVLRMMRGKSQNIVINGKPSGSSEESEDVNSSEKEEPHIDSGVAVDDSRDLGIAVLLINFQNEFCDPDGRLYSLAKVGMQKNNTLSKATELAKMAREKGATVIHAPTILHDNDQSDMTKYSKEGDLFKAGTWNSEFCTSPGTSLTPTGQDIVTPGKTCNMLLGTNLKDVLIEKKIKTLFVCGFLMEFSVHETVVALCTELDDTDIIIVDDCCATKSLVDREALIKSQSMRFMAQSWSQQRAKQAIINASGTAKGVHTAKKMFMSPKRHTAVNIHVNRTLPMTMDLPGNPTRRTTTRASVLGGRNEALPVAEKDFTVPQRRTLIDFQVEGFTVTGSIAVEQDKTDITEESSFKHQFMFLFLSQWKLYGPTCISLLRVGEVTSLAFFTGALFYNIGNNNSATGFGSINSLLFFSVTLWTFTRMYPAINTYYDWNAKLIIISNEHRYSLVPAFLARCVVVLIAESGWPFLYVIVCYPLASMAGSWNAMVRIALMLSLNNICYISLGACLGVTVKKIPQGMIISTIVAQSSLVAAGFYTEVPPFLAWLRYISPVFWTYRGIVKSSFHWSDTFKCRWGSTLAGVNSCFVEFHTAINNLKERGINVATFGDKQSTSIWLECIVLVLFYSAMQAFICVRSLMRQKREDRWEAHFERLAEYKAVHGNCNVPIDCSVRKIKLGSWVQVIQKRKKKLTEEQVERLDELGFGWEIKHN